MPQRGDAKAGGDAGRRRLFAMLVVPLAARVSRHAWSNVLQFFRAEAARGRLRTLMALNDFAIDRRGTVRYGRTIAVIYADGEDVGARLVREGFAKPWPGL